MAREDDDEVDDNKDEDQFGDPNLLSTQDYLNKIHAPDTYGHPDRSPASDDEDAGIDEESKDADATEEDLTAPKELNETADDLKSQLSEEAPEEVEPSKALGAGSQLSKFQDYMAQYKKLQDQQRKSDLVAGLAAAGGQVGQAMAGKYSGNFVPDQSGVQMLTKMGERPMQQFEQGMAVEKAGYGLNAERAASDPSSPISHMVRDYAEKRLGLKLDPQVSAADAQMLLKTIGRPTQTKFQQMPMVSQKTGAKIMGTFNPTTNTFQDTAGNQLDSTEWVRDYRAQSFIDPKTQERLSFNAGTGKVAGALTGPGVNAPVVPQKAGDLTANTPIDLNRSFLNAQQAKQVDHTREKFIQEVKDDRNSLNANDRVIQVLEAGEELGDLPREVQDQLNRAFGQKGHISDAQLGGLLGKADWKNRVENAVSLGMEGKLTPENRKFLLDVAKLIKQQNESYIDKKSQIYTQNLYKDLKSSPNLSKYQFGPDSVKGLLGVESAVHPEGPQAKQDPKISDYVKKHPEITGGYEQAKALLVGRGYKPEEQ